MSVSSTFYIKDINKDAIRLSQIGETLAKKTSPEKLIEITLLELEKLIKSTPSDSKSSKELESALTGMRAEQIRFKRLSTFRSPTPGPSSPPAILRPIAKRTSIPFQINTVQQPVPTFKPIESPISAFTSRSPTPSPSTEEEADAMSIPSSDEEPS